MLINSEPLEALHQKLVRQSAKFASHAREDFALRNRQDSDRFLHESVVYRNLANDLNQAISQGKC